MTFIQELPVQFNKRHANNIAKKLMEWQDTHVSVSDRDKNDLYFILHITVPPNPGKTSSSLNPALSTAKS